MCGVTQSDDYQIHSFNSLESSRLLTEGEQYKK